MTKTQKQDLLDRATQIKGRRQRRYVDGAEIDAMAQLDRKRSLAGKTIRVYSVDGFVPSSYKYRAAIDCVERCYDEDGKKMFSIISVDATRPHGKGSLVTVNGRAY